MDEDALLRRLISAETLQSRAATEGERTAARRACRRLRQRLDRHVVSRKVVVLEAFAEHPGVCPVVEDEVLAPPECSELRLRVRLWAEGRCSRAAVVEWAARFVQGTVLPVYAPDDPRSLTMEVVLQLASLDSLWLGRAHARDVLDVLECADATEGWARWFALLERVARSRCVQP